MEHLEAKKHQVMEIIDRQELSRKLEQGEYAPSVDDSYHIRTDGHQLWETSIRLI